MNPPTTELLDEPVTETPPARSDVLRVTALLEAEEAARAARERARVLDAQRAALVLFQLD